MPDDLPYMRLWIGDLFGDPAVRAMDESEFGLYMLALCCAWQDGKIPADEKKRAKALGVTVTRLHRLWPAIEDKWEPDSNGGLVNPRQERERREATKAHAKRVAAGKRRWGK